MNASTDPAPSAPPAADFVGFIDDVANGVISGWAVTKFGEPTEVRITVNGRDYPLLVANQVRMDLQIAGQSSGRGGWFLDIGDALIDGENRIEVIFPDRSPVTGSPLVFTGRSPTKATPAPTADAELRYLGAIDQRHPPLIVGWAASSAGKSAPVTIEIEGRAAIEVQSAGTRADLGKQGVTQGDGGWHYELGDIGSTPMSVHIRFPDGTDLPGSPLRFNQRLPEDAPPPETPEMAAAEAGSTVVPTPAPAPPPAPAPAPAATQAPQSPAPQPAPALVTQATPQPKTGPSLAELDEISLDDLAAAVEAGIIYVPPPPPPPEPEPEVEQRVADVAEQRPQRKGFLSRLFGR